MALTRTLCHGVALIVFVGGHPAHGADRPLPASVGVPVVAPIAPNDSWTGFYLGAHLGFAAGRSGSSATQPTGAPNLTGSLDFTRAFDLFTGAGSYLGGVQAGYNYMLSPRILAGVEADISFPNTIAAGQDFMSPFIGAANYRGTVEMFGTVRGRLGYDVNHWLFYATGGLAWTYDQFTRTQLTDSPTGAAPAGTVETAFLGRIGWTAGAGIEAPIASGWSGKLEYLFAQFGHSAVTFPQGGQTFWSDLAMHEVRAGLNYRLGAAAGDAPIPPPLESGDWAVHGQTTLLSQYAPRFSAPYHGANSLDPNAGRETWDATLYIGRRLWEGAELWINPEIDQGFGISGTLGVAGFTSGEAYKVGASYPYVRLPRTFIRQTINLGGDTQKVESDINQFAAAQTADRLVVTIGKFGVPDVFDTISFAHDPRNDFMNWALADAGTFDYAADAWGYTYGAAAEWYQDKWTLRGGVFDMSIVPNSSDLDRHFGQFQTIYELEHRHELWGMSGKVAVMGFLSRGRMGRFDDAIAFGLANASPASTAAVRRYASRAGGSANLEQQIAEGIGLFGRVGFADGNVEPYEFTDIDRTATVGFSVSGKRWNRPDDTFGVAGIMNGISAAHRAYLNAGGLGVLVGDGQLPHPGYEQIVETYYTFPLGAWKATGDYQFIANPGYNRDRGPVSVVSGRLRRQF
jgi:high affinity Mn2+ porin